MKKNHVTKFLTASFAMLLATFFLSTHAQQRDAKAIEEALKDDMPRVLCINENFTAAGQPKPEAFAKIAKQGFRAVLNLRTAEEGAGQERELVEKAGLRYLNIPVAVASPDPAQVPEFIKAVKDPANQPMFIHCGGAQRVAALWMIYRVTEQGWTEEKAMGEAVKIGLEHAGLIKFAKDYLASHRK